MCGNVLVVRFWKTLGQCLLYMLPVNAVWEAEQTMMGVGDTSTTKEVCPAPPTCILRSSTQPPTKVTMGITVRLGESQSWTLIPLQSVNKVKPICFQKKKKRMPHGLSCPFPPTGEHLDTMAPSLARTRPAPTLLSLPEDCPSG